MTDLDPEALAGALYTAAHKGIRNCWKWDDDGLDHEHPAARAYWCKIANNLLAGHTVSVTREESNAEHLSQEKRP